ncbi:hypothetical protein V1478_007766 [Vespula squamosa]|uniref:Uncharacterized protein n=1 Tax=Vespula squamosa TaxID=30214 RepID=A0ABD2AWW5_VESSQ
MPTIRYARKPLPTSPWHVDTRKTDFDASFDRLENHPLTFLPRDHLPTRTDNFWSFRNTDDADGSVCKVIDKKGELGDPLDFKMNGEDLTFTIHSPRRPDDEEDEDKEEEEEEDEGEEGTSRKIPL